MSEPRILDANASTLVVRTRAVGLMARLAHDLEITAAGLRGEVGEGSEWSGRIVIPVDRLTVSGAVKADRVDASVLSSSDRVDILKRMRSDAFRGASEVVVKATGTSRTRAELEVAIGPAIARASAAITVVDGAQLEVSGSCPLSLRALGAKDIKGPLGAFKVEDEVVVAFHLVFA